MALAAQDWVALVEALSWPLLVLFLVLYFGRPIRSVLQKAREFTFKAGPGGIEATAKAAEAGALLGAAAEKARQQAGGMAASPFEAEGIGAVVEEAFDEQGNPRLQGRRILWVDDNPGNNVYERQALEALGLNFDLALSTNEALGKLAAGNYDLVISDMGRPPDPRAGYTLLDALAERGQKVPFVIYAGSRSPEHVAESVAHGAIGTTNSPQELFELVLRGLQTFRGPRRKGARRLAGRG